MKITLLLALAVLLQSCWVSRTYRPKLSGYVYDNATKKPINDCAVGETFTDSTGHYQLAEMRYGEFTFIGFEAGPVRVFELVVFEGYEVDTIQAYNPFGAGMRKGAHWHMDTVFLNREN